MRRWWELLGLEAPRLPERWARVRCNEEPGADAGGGGGGDPPADPPADPAGDPPADPPPAEPPLLDLTGGKDGKPPADPGNGQLKDYDWEADPLKLKEVKLPENVKFGKKYGTLADLWAGFQNAQKLLGQKGLVAPEEYTIPEDKLGAWAEDSREAYVSWAKELGLNQSQFEKAAEGFQELANEIETEKQEARLYRSWGLDPDAQGDQLKYAERNGKLSRWAVEQVQTGRLRAEAVEELARTADGIQALEMMMTERLFEKGFWMGRPSQTGGLTQADVDALQKDPKSAYNDANHPEHARTREKVRQFFLAQPGGNEPLR